VDGAGKIPPASSGGDKLLSSGTRGDPTDASGAFRPDPRAPTEALPPFFQNSKLIPQIEYVDMESELLRCSSTIGFMAVIDSLDLG